MFDIKNLDANQRPNPTIPESRPANDYQERITYIALPFLALYRPTAIASSLILGTLQSFAHIRKAKFYYGLFLHNFYGVNSSAQQCRKYLSNASFELIQLTGVVSSVAVGIFAPAAGIVVSHSYQVAKDVDRLASFLEKRKIKEAGWTCLSITHSVIYIGSAVFATYELIAISLIAQAALELYQGYQEYRKGHLLETAAKVTMATIRILAAKPYIQNSYQKWFVPLTQADISGFLEQLKNDPSISIEKIEPRLKELDQTFDKHVELKHPRDIYSIYEALTEISNQVAASNNDSAKAAWGKILQTWDQRKILINGLGETSLDTSLAQEILKTPLSEIQKSITTSIVDLKDESHRNEIADYIHQSDREAFGSCAQKDFFHEILKSEDVRCAVARDGNNQIVGILWGFLSKHEDRQFFHFWQLSRKPSMAKLGIANSLIELAKAQQKDHPEIEFVTLNVNSDNQHAKELYESEEFNALSEQEKEALKIFMSRQLSDSDTGISMTIAEAKDVVKDFVLKTIPIYKLLPYELVRQSELLWRAIWYRSVQA